jgi:hypothetical protein
MTSHSCSCRSNQANLATSVKIHRLFAKQGIRTVHGPTTKQSVESPVIYKHETNLPQFLTDVRKKQGDGMCGTSLNMNPRVLGRQQIPGLLNVASAIEKDTINTSTHGIKFLDPWIKKRGDENRILLSTLLKMIGTCASKVAKQQSTKNRLVV